MFPPEYQPFIVGNLPFDQIDKAYKGYKYAINLNSIKQSQSMFARRVFDLLGSNTITVSNYSRGVRLMFGDLVLTSDSGIELLRRLRELCGDEVAAAKLRLAALRKVMGEHTYQDRLAYVVAKVRNAGAAELLPHIVVVAYAKNDGQVQSICQSFRRQLYARKSLVMVIPGGFAAQGLPDGARVVEAAEAQHMSMSSLGSSSDWIGAMVPDDYYGPNYLNDIALATRYARGNAIGKVARHVWSPTKGVRMLDAERRYRTVDSVPVRSGAAMLDGLDHNLRQWIGTLYTARFSGVDALSIDEFNYCQGGGAGLSDSDRAKVDDALGLNVGLPLDAILRTAERIAPAPQDECLAPQLAGASLAKLFVKPPPGAKAWFEVDADVLAIRSDLDDGKHEYWYSTVEQRPDDLGATNGRLKFHLEVTPGLNVQLVLLFLDEQRQRISNVVKHANRNHDVEIPSPTAFIRLGLRVYASGTASVRALYLGHRSVDPAAALGSSDALVLTNHYPSDEDLYRNAFVHRRVLQYAKRGKTVDVFRLRDGEAVSYHEYENVDCTTGSQTALDRMLSSGRYRSVLVHFLDEQMWTVLKGHVDRLKMTVWVHGAEIQPYHRRAFLYSTDAERESARKRSDARMAFWRDLLRHMPPNLSLVFVSQKFANEVMDDLGIRLPDSGYRVIHNPIDTELFAYAQKPPLQRAKILSVRPYSSAVYANDLAVRAIQTLSAKPFFADLEFHLIGDGPLFEQTVAPLRGFDNVRIERRFLTQREIAVLHRQYGVFLCPSRMDTQGVSRDEAMASGLVPVTSRVGAIEEFVDESCGVLSRAESHADLAEAIERLYMSPELFSKLSEAAARRVRRQSGAEQIIAQELMFLQQEPPAAPSRRSSQRVRRQSETASIISTELTLLPN